MNERTLHDQIEEIVSGAGDSSFTRWLAAHYRKKGVLEKEKREKEAP